MKFPSAGIFLKETIIKLSKMSHFKAFRRKYHWGNSSCDIHVAPLPLLPTVGLPSALGPQQPCESCLMTCSHEGFWAHGPRLGNLKLFQPPGFWWLLSLAERGGERAGWQESRRCSAGAPARWVKITIPFAEWAIFSGKLYLSEFFLPSSSLWAFSASSSCPYPPLQAGHPAQPECPMECKVSCPADPLHCRGPGRWSSRQKWGKQPRAF